MEKGIKVCVTGGAGFIGSSLIRKLLHRGYTVHATLRNLDDESKVGLLKSFTGADKRLELFKADIYKPEEFEGAIEGCETVFHVAMPFQHTEGYEYNNRVEATIAAAKCIANSCTRSTTTKRLIYTASVVAASPLKDDGIGFKHSMDETCWTSIDLPFAYSEKYLKDYTHSKTLAEKDILSVGNDSCGGLEVVSLACGLVGGNSCLSYTPLSVVVFLSLITNDINAYQSLKFLEDFLGKVPIVHIEDVCEALIFSLEAPSMNGRFLCSSSYVAIAEMADYYKRNYPAFHVEQEYLDGIKRQIDWPSTKLNDVGFVYKYDMKEILDDCINCARKAGDLPCIN